MKCLSVTWSAANALKGLGVYGCALFAGTVQWTKSDDPVLTRYGVGCLARLAISGPEGAALVAKCGGFAAFVEALGDTDGQTQCYAAKAAGTHPVQPEDN